MKTEPLGYVTLQNSATDIAGAIQIAIAACETKFITERQVDEDVIMHPSTLTRGMKVRPIIFEREWCVEFRNGDSYRILKTTAQSEGIR